MAPSTLWRNSVSPAVSAIARRLSPFLRVRRLRALAHSVPPPVYAFLPHMRLSYVTSSPSGALRRLRVRWRGLARRAWPAVAFKVCPLRAAPSARHLAAALHSLVANAGCERQALLCTQWPDCGSNVRPCAMVRSDAVLLASKDPRTVHRCTLPPPSFSRTINTTHLLSFQL